MRFKKNEPVAPVYGGYPVDPAYASYMKKCMKKYPFLYRMVDYIVDSKIAALRAEFYQMGMFQPMSPGMMCPGGPYQGMPYPGMMGPVAGPQTRPGYSMMPM
jgi:hypothetical protein